MSESETIKFSELCKKFFEFKNFSDTTKKGYQYCFNKINNTIT